MTPKEIRSRRLALGLSVDALARELRLPAEAVRAIERGDDPPLPDPDILDRVLARIEAAKNHL